MTTEYPLFAQAHARKSDPETSHEAAAKQTPRKLRRSQAAVLRALRALTEATDPEIEHYIRESLGETDHASSRLRTARKELEGTMVEWTGERVERRGSRFRTWRVKP